MYLDLSLSVSSPLSLSVGHSLHLCMNMVWDFYFNDITIYMHNDRIHILVRADLWFCSPSTCNIYIYTGSYSICIGFIGNPIADDNNDNFHQCKILLLQICVRLSLGRRLIRSYQIWMCLFNHFISPTRIN